MDKKILITGATGLIGKKIVYELSKQSTFIKIISTDADKARQIFKDQPRVQAYNWSDFKNLSDLSELVGDVDAVINLAGVNVGESRWNNDFKNKIYHSRIDTTKSIVDAIAVCKKRPECLINASAVGIYGFRGDEELDEDSGPGDDFLARLCIEWESEALKAAQFDVRVVTVRAGIVLEKNEGALKNFLLPFKFSIGTYMGSGKQWLPWIHIEDVAAMYIFALENNKLYGAVNAVAPELVTNKEFVKMIGSIYKKNILLPVPEIALRIGVGEFAGNLVTGQKVYSRKSSVLSFSYKYPELKMALKNLLDDTK